MQRHRQTRNSRGFTLIELLLVVGIIGVLLAVIVPKAIRANINAKYGIVEKNCAELKSYAAQWAEKSIRAQDEQLSTATLADYYASLAGASSVQAGQGQQWIAVQQSNNWNLIDGATVKPIPINGRYQQGNANQPPEDVVESMIPPEKALKNPFNGTSVFRAPNDPATQGKPVTGAIALGFLQEPEATGAFYYFALAYQGTDNTIADLTNNDSFHAGSGLADIPALKNAQLFARLR